jgi:hypothetical protein
LPLQTRWNWKLLDIEKTFGEVVVKWSCGRLLIALGHVVGPVTQADGGVEQKSGLAADLVAVASWTLTETLKQKEMIIKTENRQ